ncbi:MAG: HAMP domain-containing histidine kinase [Actinomycetota bacterium]|nr:HAMP domain-containing histidine kinase [Actinomycetota bacterium]
MKLLPGLRESKFWPPSWPIRWKLSAVSSGLTFVILVAFGFVVGQLTTQQLRENYAADTEAAAEELASDIRRVRGVTPAYLVGDRITMLVENAGGPADITSIVTSLPETISSRDADKLGPPRFDRTITQSDGYQVATIAYEDPPGSGSILGYIRVGRPIARLESSINRIWISVLAGTLGATLLAALAGVVLSRRAMRPISKLTSAAGEIARTRDPSITLENPVADDEVSELTRTFNDMLHELSLARTERERSLARQREFVADASHELRTPLTSVLANLELLEHSLTGRDRDLELESVESALRSSQRMRRLVADLQILARADSGRTQTMKPCDLAEIAEDAINEVAPLSESHTIELKAPEPVIIEGAADDLHRVILNLVDNAVSHTPDRSTITVSVSADREKSEAILSVADDGPGIPVELWPRIFDRFVRNTGPGDRASSIGTGLGLAIVATISRGHGGSASVGDSPSGGAMFTVSLPLLADETSNDSESQGNR